jgi:hypothetical protein
MQLPPPDPYESFGMPPEEEVRLSHPAVVYLAGPPSPEAGRISDAMMAWRPGALIVVARH